MNITDLSASQLRKAAALKEQMEQLQAELNTILGTAAPAAIAPATSKKRTMSAAARALISAAQKKRWAGQRPASAPKPRKTKGKMSPSVKAKLSASLKEAWARRKAAQKK